MSRRPAIPLLLALVLVAGACTAAPRPGADPGALGAEPAPAAAGSAPTGDEALVVRAVEVSVGLRAVVTTAGRRHPRLTGRLAPLRRLHARHRLALVGALPEETPPASPDADRALRATPTAAAALRQLRRRERQGGSRLLTMAVEAESGRFARLLASMAAALAQARVALGAPTPEGGAAATPGGPGTEGGRSDPRARSSEGSVTALRDALAAEHAAVWTYGVLGARTSASASPGTFAAVDSAYRTHRARRDGLVAQLRGLGAATVAASPSYRLPAEVDSPGAVRRVARGLEEDTAGWWSALVATSVGPLRRDAAAAMADAAVRGLGFADEPRTFPGLGELEGD